MYSTRIDLDAELRGRMMQLLNARLAEALDLTFATKQAHWNVKGPHFISLHELFDQLHAHIVEHVDVIAERITALGGVALGTVQTVARTSSLAPYPQDIADGTQHLEALAARLADFGKKVRAAITEADECADADTADLFTQVSRDVDKDLWFLEAHLQGKR